MRGPTTPKRKGRTWLSPTHRRTSAKDRESQMMFDRTHETAPSWHLTYHARRRAAERGITYAELFGAVNQPEVTYDQSDYGPNRQMRQRGRISAVVDLSTGAVITAVFRSRDHWLAQTVRSHG